MTPKGFCARPSSWSTTPCQLSSTCGLQNEDIDHLQARSMQLHIIFLHFIALRLEHSIMKSLTSLATAILLMVHTLPAQTILFEDTYDRADNADINLNAAADQSGTAAPLTYSTFGTTGDSSISSNRLSLNTNTSNATTRAALQYNFSNSSSAIVDDGGFEFEFTVDPGTNWVSGPHGAYAIRIFLSQQSVVNGTVGQTNPFQSLVFSIQGNGNTQAFSQGSTILSPLIAPSWNVQGLNDIRLTVETDGFATSSSNFASLFINDVAVASDLAFSWTNNNNAYFALESTTNTSQFTNLTATTIPEPSSVGLLGLGLGLLLFRKRVQS